MKAIIFICSLSINFLLNAQPNSWSLLLDNHDYNRITNDSKGNLYASFLNSDTSSCVIKSTDQGKSWDTILICPSSLTLPTDIFIDTIFTPNDRIIISSTGNVNYLSSDYGTNWEEFNTPGRIFDFKSTGEIICFNLGEYNLYGSSDNGVTWYVLNLPEPTYTDYWLNKLEVDIYDNIYIDIHYGRNNFPPQTWDEIYKSTDNGNIWTLFYHTDGWGQSSLGANIYSTSAGDLFISDPNNYPNYTVHYLKSGAQHFYNFIAYSPWQVKSDQIYLLNDFYPSLPKALFSPDSGNGWQDISSGISEHMQNSYLCNDSLGYLYINQYVSGKIYKTTFTTRNIFKSATLDFGEIELYDTSFVQVTLQNPFNFNITIDSIISYDSHFFVTELQNNIIPSHDTLSTFMAYTPNSLDTNQTYIYLYSEYVNARIHLMGQGVNPSSIINLKNLSSDFQLLQNYPNPFNPTTKIKYQLPELSKVKLTIYDVLGREIKTLVNEEKPAGTYEVEFSAKGGSSSSGDALNLSSGIYFYRIEAGKFSDTKKFILLK